MTNKYICVKIDRPITTLGGDTLTTATDNVTFFEKMTEDFHSHVLLNEDDVKLHFYADIVKPIIKKVNPYLESTFNSERTFQKGGRADATYQNISFEYKKPNEFRTQRGIDDALFGRIQNNDHGLKHYLISNSDVSKNDLPDEVMSKLLKSYGVGFDGNEFIFARYVQTKSDEILDTSGTDLEGHEFKIPIQFSYEKTDFQQGLFRLTLILKQEHKLSLTKKNVLSVVNPKTKYVRNNILKTYKLLEESISDSSHPNYSQRAVTLFNEWDQVFGKIYGNEEDETDFTSVTPAIKKLYNINNSVKIDSKLYLFSLQTFYNIFLKLLVNSFLSHLINPTFTTTRKLDRFEISSLFDGENQEQNQLVRNFFESHFLEWFTYSLGDDIVDIVQETNDTIDMFDLSSFVLKPEAMQDIFQEIYMELIPKELRHIMGEYFSPDWIVEHVLDMVGFDGENIESTLIDPTCGSGTFITQALKRIIEKKDGKLSKSDITTIIDNVVGFDINPISVVAAKANYIMTIFSAYFNHHSQNEFEAPIDIPIYIADSVLSPVVYSKSEVDSITINTSVGKFTLPHFDDIHKSNEFLRILSRSIHEKSYTEVHFQEFFNQTLGLNLIEECQESLVRKLFQDLNMLHRSGKDSFWPIILRNSFAPVMISKKFDYVVGNPPWIGWKSMSKSYREGTLDVWQSYGIFEKSAYDKKTTHDDFGMAVTYVAVDQYLKIGGKLGFLTPASFLKSTKGGQGFRKFEIIRNGQQIPFKIEQVHDFSGVKLFTVPTIAMQLVKGEKMEYPLTEYIEVKQKGKKSAIDSHAHWQQVRELLTTRKLKAQPIDTQDNQSAWLTLSDNDFSQKVLTGDKPIDYRGRKGIEPAGAKGVYVLNKVSSSEQEGLLKIENDMSRQRRVDLKSQGSQPGIIEEEFVYPMLGGRNIEKWRVKSNEFILVPHDKDNIYGIPTTQLARRAPRTYSWLKYYHDGLLASRIQNGKFFNPETQPFYRLDNVGVYSYSPYKVLWKEQTKNMSAVVVGTYYDSIPNADINLFSSDKPIMVDSKVLMLACDNAEEAYYVCGIINAPSITEVIDGYAIQTNRGTDVLKYIHIPKFNPSDATHKSVSETSKKIHEESKLKKLSKEELDNYENLLDVAVTKLYTENV